MNTDAMPARARLMLGGKKFAVVGIGLALLLVAGLLLRWPSRGPDASRIVEYPMAVATDIPTAVAPAADGSVWFSIDFSDAVGVVRAGKVERLVKGSRNAEPIGIAIDGQGTAWVTDAAATAITGVLPNGQVRSVRLGTPVARLGRMAAAPDGSVWFAESSSDSITQLKDGELRRHPLLTLRGGPYGVGVASDGTTWATLQSANALVSIGADHKVVEHPIPTAGTSPTDVAVDASGAVWFLQFRTERIGRFHQGKFDEHVLPRSKVGLTGLATAPDGAVWFGMLREGGIGRLRNGEFTLLKLPRQGARPFSVAVDRAGNVWYADIGGTIGMLPAAEASR